MALSNKHFGEMAASALTQGGEAIERMLKLVKAGDFHMAMIEFVRLNTAIGAVQVVRKLAQHAGAPTEYLDTLKQQEETMVALGTDFGEVLARAAQLGAEAAAKLKVGGGGPPGSKVLNGLRWRR